MLFGLNSLRSRLDLPLGLLGVGAVFDSLGDAPDSKNAAPTPPSHFLRVNLDIAAVAPSRESCSLSFVDVDLIHLNHTITMVFQAFQYLEYSLMIYLGF